MAKTSPIGKTFIEVGKKVAAEAKTAANNIKTSDELARLNDEAKVVARAIADEGKDMLKKADKAIDTALETPNGQKVVNVVGGAFEKLDEGAKKVGSFLKEVFK